jgi:murein DD-endopeptidase MepM/ murein hydrolase activator NlpD
MKYFNIVFFSYLALFLGSKLFSQPSSGDITFRHPLDFNLSVSGNFGEIRTDHFHSGIDIRTQGVTGKKVFAAAGGYISRIKIETGGYGKTLYVTHPNGLMTVYAHLDHFTPEIEKYVKYRQYEEKTHAINIFPLKSDFPVNAGQHIAYSGNTGYSFGPHLHFEVRNAATQNIRNALLYDFDISDEVPPKMFSVCLYPAGDNSWVNNSQDKLIIPLSGENGNYRIRNEQSLFVSGKIGFGIEAYDYLDGTASRCGIYIIELYVDSSMVFSCRMDEFSFNESRYINSFVDYGEKQRTGRNIQKAFIDPNNRLSVYDHHLNNGLVVFSDDKSHLISFVLKDAYFNTSRLDFTVTGQIVSNIINRDSKKDFIQFMPCSILNTFHRDDIQLVIPSGALYTDLEFEYSKSENIEGLFSILHNIHNIYTPLHTVCELMISLKHCRIKLF